jgi:hypothetical protein
VDQGASASGDRSAGLVAHREVRPVETLANDAHEFRRLQVRTVFAIRDAEAATQVKLADLVSRRRQVPHEAQQDIDRARVGLQRVEARSQVKGQGRRLHSSRPGEGGPGLRYLRRSEAELGIRPTGLQRGVSPGPDARPHPETHSCRRTLQRIARLDRGFHLVLRLQNHQVQTPPDTVRDRCGRLGYASEHDAPGRHPRGEGSGHFPHRRSFEPDPV